MGNGVRKPLTARVRPKELEIVTMEAFMLEQVGRGQAKRIRRPTYSDITASMQILTAFIGNLRSPYRRLSRAGLLLWILSMAVNFLYDGYESRVTYGYPWVSVRALLWVTCCAGTWLVVRRTMPWLEQGIKILEEDKIYRQALRDIDSTTKKLPYFLLSFALAAGSLQYGMMRLDQATHLGFGQSLHAALEVPLHILRFISGVHVFYALALFWSVPTCVMLLVGFSMIEYQDRTRSQLRIKGSSLTFKRAVDSFNERVEFVRDSSSACMVLLSILLLFTILSLALNAYIFLFVNRSRYVYIVHALLPLFLAAYPLSTASWVTKQYHWHLVAVVKAWVECPESDSSDSESEQHSEQHVNKTFRVSSSDCNKQHAPESSLRIHMPDIGHVTVNQPQPSSIKQDNIERLQNIFYGSARVVGRLQQRRKKLPKFNFEKYITYLEKVSHNIGFSIGGVLVTWELVSAVFFFLISLIALFLQESIFGKTESTIKI